MEFFIGKLIKYAAAMSLIQFFFNIINIAFILFLWYFVKLFSKLLPII